MRSHGEEKALKKKRIVERALSKKYPWYKRRFAIYSFAFNNFDCSFVSPTDSRIFELINYC